MFRKFSKKILMKRNFEFSYEIHVWRQHHVKTEDRKASKIWFSQIFCTFGEKCTHVGNILLQAGAERKVSFDWGPDGSKAEDCFFGIVALDQVVKYFFENIKYFFESVNYLLWIINNNQMKLSNVSLKLSKIS